MKIRRGFACVEDGDIVRQHGVQGLAPGDMFLGFGCVEVSHLPQCVHARVRAARAVQAYRFAADAGETVLYGALDGRP